jgi:hypothetical protein
VSQNRLLPDAPKTLLAVVTVNQLKGGVS